MKRIRIRPLGFLFLLNTALLAALVAALIWRFAAPAAQPSPPPARAAASLPPVTEALPPVTEAPFQAMPVAQAPAPEPPAIAADWYLARCERLRRDLTAYGGYADAAAVEAALQAMELDPEGKMVALTFDDGPDPRHTPQVLALLRQYNARATFFIVGQNIPGNEALLREILGCGCEIGNHTQAHTNLRDVSADEARAAIVEVNDALYDLLGYDTCLLRPPYGSYRTEDGRIRELARELGMSIIMWRRSVHDSHVPTPAAEEIAARALLEVDEDGGRLDGAILLLHDRYDETVEALAAILPALVERGYQLVTVSELLMSTEGGMNPGGVYRCRD